jgi:hypothetical protein
MDDKVPTTPPAKVPPLSPGEMPTVIVKEDELPTPIIDYSKIKAKSKSLGKRNLQEEFENADKKRSKDDAHSEYLQKRIESIKKQLQKTQDEYDKVTDEYEKRLEETAKMTFKLPSTKKHKNKDRKSSNKKKQNRKNTSNKMSRK